MSLASNQKSDIIRFDPIRTMFSKAIIHGIKAEVIRLNKELIEHRLEQATACGLGPFSIERLHLARPHTLPSDFPSISRVGLSVSPVNSQQWLFTFPDGSWLHCDQEDDSVFYAGEPFMWEIFVAPTVREFS